MRQFAPRGTTADKLWSDASKAFGLAGPARPLGHVRTQLRALSRRGIRMDDLRHCVAPERPKSDRREAFEDAKGCLFATPLSAGHNYHGNVVAHFMARNSVVGFLARGCPWADLRAANAIITGRG